MDQTSAEYLERPSILLVSDGRCRPARETRVFEPPIASLAHVLINRCEQRDDRDLGATVREISDQRTDRPHRVVRVGREYEYSLGGRGTFTPGRGCGSHR